MIRANRFARIALRFAHATKVCYICANLSGIVSCDAAAVRIRIVRCEQHAKREKHKPCETEAPFSPLLPVGSPESVLKVPKRGQFPAATRVTTKHCDSCVQGALGRRMVSTVSWRNFLAMRNRWRRLRGYGESQLSVVRKSSGHRPGVPGTPGGTNRGPPACVPLLNRKGHFCRDTGRVSQGQAAVQGIFGNVL